MKRYNVPFLENETKAERHARILAAAVFDDAADKVMWTNGLDVDIAGSLTGFTETVVEGGVLDPRIEPVEGA